MCFSNSCPDCRTVNDGVERFSVVAGNISDLLELECANESKGCKEKLLRPDIVKHENVCIYTANLVCPYFFLNCKVKVSYMSCIEHMVKVHQNRNYPSYLLGVRAKLKSDTHNNHGKWSYESMSKGIAGSDDHLILVGQNIGDYVLIFVKCLSKDRSQRYSLELEISDDKSKKTNFGQTLLMTEDCEMGIRAGNVLEVHSKAYEKFQRSGNMVICFKLKRIDDNKNDEDQKNETNQEGDSKSSVSRVKRPLQNMDGGESNKKKK